MTASAMVGWSARLGWIHLSGSHPGFTGSAWAISIFTLGALVEFIADQLSTTPARMTAAPLAARMFMGWLTGAGLGSAGGSSRWLGARTGAIGAIAGAFGGYQARERSGFRNCHP